MKACNVLYWSLIIPILTYGSELWFLKGSDIELLDKYQRYAGRRVQRFPAHSPSETSFRGLGWIRIENFIYAKKLIFILKILIRDEDCIFKKILEYRAIKFNNDVRNGILNEFDSPLFDIMRVSIIFNMYDILMSMIFRNQMYSKTQWEKMVWANAWRVEDNDWQYSVILYDNLSNLDMTNGGANPTRFQSSLMHAKSWQSFHVERVN